MGRIGNVAMCEQTERKWIVAVKNYLIVAEKLSETLAEAVKH